MGKASKDEGIMTGMPRWLKLLGVGSWLVLGFIALVVGLYFGLAQLSGLLIPLAVAVVVGMIFYPLVDRLAAYFRALGQTAKRNQVCLRA